MTERMDGVAPGGGMRGGSRSRDDQMGCADAVGREMRGLNWRAPSLRWRPSPNNVHRACSPAVTYIIMRSTPSGTQAALPQTVPPRLRCLRHGERKTAPVPLFYRLSRPRARQSYESHVPHPPRLQGVLTYSPSQILSRGVRFAFPVIIWTRRLPFAWTPLRTTLNSRLSLFAPVRRGLGLGTKIRCIRCTNS